MSLKYECSYFLKKEGWWEGETALKKQVENRLKRRGFFNKVKGKLLTICETFIIQPVDYNWPV